MSKAEKPQNDRGFTLLEIIVTLVVASILASMVVQITGFGVTESVEPISMVQKGYALSQVMENITSDYLQLAATESDPLVQLKGRITAGNNSGNDPYYGEYTVETNDFITFSGQTAQAAVSSNYLKVTISSADTGQTLTALFTK